MKKQLLFKLGTLLFLLSSCSSVSKMATEKDVKTDALHRSEYTVSEDKVAEASVTQTLGLYYKNKDVKHKKGIIKMNTGNLTIGNFNLNLSGVLFASVLTIGVGYGLNNFDFATNTYRKHSEMEKVDSKAVYMPTGFSYTIGLIAGFGINALVAPCPSKRAESLAKYNFITDNKFDYIINPRFELEKKNNFLKKTATIKLTAKGMNIITDK